MAINDNAKEFWSKHLRSFGLLLIFHLFSLASIGQTNQCNIGELPSVVFRSHSGGLSDLSKSMLESVANELKGSPFCNILVSGYPSANKAGEALCNKRLAAIKTYLVEAKGISADRIDVTCESGGGDPNTVDLKTK